MYRIETPEAVPPAEQVVLYKVANLFVAVIRGRGQAFAGTRFPAGFAAPPHRTPASTRPERVRR